MKRLSPSQLANLELCPRFQSSSGTSQAAERGTACHEAMETGSLVGLTPDEKDAVRLCQLYSFNITVDPSVSSIHNEVKLHAMQLNRQSVEGTADRVVVHQGGEVDVLDWKFGVTAIEDAETNLQGQCYALGAFKRWKAKKVTVHFVVPYQDETTSHTFYAHDVDKIRHRLLLIAAMQRKRRKPYRPNDKACHWCDKKSSCPGLTKKAVDLSHTLADLGLQLPNITDVTKEIDPVDRSKCQALAVVLEDWCKQVKKANALACREDPSIIAQMPGFSLVSRKGNRTVPDSFMLIDFLMNTADIPVDHILPECTMKVTAVELALKEYAKKKGDKHPEEYVCRIMESLDDIGLVSRGMDITFLKRVKTKKNKK